KVAWDRARVEQLVNRLADERPVVRQRAQQLLAARGKAAVAALQDVLKHRKDGAVRQRAPWALAANADAAAVVALRSVLQADDPDLVIPALRVLALRKDREVTTRPCALLRDGIPAVRLAAAEALAHCGDAEVARPLLWEALCRQPDRFLDHALIHALHRRTPGAALEHGLRQPDPRVQSVALLLLDQPPRPPGRLRAEDVLPRVTAADADLRQTALRILQDHPEWAEQALGLIRGWLEKPTLTAEEQ